jgi:hypothetical protein
MKQYYPYKSDKPEKKYYIITNTGKKKVYFGSSDYQDFTQHKDEVRKNAYIQRHQKREDWNDPDTAGFWSRWLLWNKPSIRASYEDIKKNHLNKSLL